MKGGAALRHRNGLPSLTVTPGPNSVVRSWGLSPDGRANAIVNGLRLEGTDLGSRWESRPLTERERAEIAGIPLAKV